MIRTDIAIRPETPAEFAEIRELVRRTFKEHTPYSDGTAEAALIDEIRQSPYYLPQLSYVALLGGKIVGHFMFSRFPLSPTPQGGCGPEDATFLLLAPVAVHADFVHQGIGDAMLRLGLASAKQTECKGILVEGNPAYYTRFGFVTSTQYSIHATGGIPLEHPECQMVQESHPSSLSGVSGYVVYDMYENA